MSKPLKKLEKENESDNKITIKHTQTLQIVKIATLRLLNYLQKDSEELAPFIKNLTSENNGEFYQSLANNFHKQPHLENIKFLIVSCVIRDFISAKTLEDLKHISHSGFFSNYISQIKDAEEKTQLKEATLAKIGYPKKDQVNLSILSNTNLIPTIISIITDYLPDNSKMLDNILEYVRKGEIGIRSWEIFAPRQVEQVEKQEVTEENLKELQQDVIRELQEHQKDQQLESKSQNNNKKRKDKELDQDKEKSQPNTSPEKARAEQPKKQNLSNNIY